MSDFQHPGFLDAESARAAARRMMERRASVVGRKVGRAAKLVEKRADLLRLAKITARGNLVAHRLRQVNRRLRAAQDDAVHGRDVRNQNGAQRIDAGFEIGGHGGSFPVADARNGTVAPTPPERKSGPSE